MDADWVRWLGVIALGAIGYLAQRAIGLFLDNLKQKEKELRRELRRLSKNYHNLIEYTRGLGVTLARVCERLDIPEAPHLRDADENEDEVRDITAGDF